MDAAFHTTAHQDDWRPYFDAVAGHPPRDTLIRALALFQQESTPEAGEQGSRVRPLAIDLGAGEGRDTAELLARGWRVIAIDSSAEAIRRLMARVDIEHMPRLEARHASFVAGNWPKARLINASFSIPHATAEEFAVVWQRIGTTLEPGGRFAGQLFGIHDEWAGTASDLPRVFHSRGEVESLLASASLTPEYFEEVERPGQNALGCPKYWHVFHIVARKT